MSPQKSTLVVLHNLHIDEVDDEIKHLALLVHYFNVQIQVYMFKMMFSLSTNDYINFMNFF